jgi:hypothetical protein
LWFLSTNPGGNVALNLYLPQPPPPHSHKSCPLNIRII